MDVENLTPVQEQARHQSAILATLDPPKWKNIASGELVLLDYINELEGASERRYRLYRSTWSPALVGALVVVVMKGGRIGIIDGRHRWLAIRSEGFMFHCAVHEELSDEQVVALFLFHNQHRRNPSAAEKYHAAVASGDPVASRVSRVVGLRGVGSELRAFSASQAVVLDSASLDDGEQALNFTIRTLVDAFPATDPRRLDSTLIRAVGRFFREHGSNPKLVEERFVKALSDNGRRSATHLKTIGTSRGTSGPGAGVHIFHALETDYTRWNSGNRL